MNLSMRWLSDYVSINDKIRDFCEKMTMSGSKVEGYEVEGSEISNVVVGKVLEMERHPDSDHLWVCQIDVGQAEPVQIVTGAQNVTVGSYVPAALHKSTLPGGKEIRKGKLRGVESDGMLCSLGELGLTLHDFPYAIEDGIFLLEEPELTPGMPIQEAIGLNDTSVEFEITSNRPDCLSVLGLAREAAATYGGSFVPSVPVVKGVPGSPEDFVHVSVEAPDLCSRYIARVVKNVKIGPSPRWMRERLRASGVRPINNLVDITNYVCLEYGQPMHAFDLRDIGGAQINVRRAKDGERLVLLDGTDKPLTSDMLVIADAEKPIGMAGVMGGENSGVREDTTTVVFESAMFDWLSVRLTAKALGVRTEASSRFEKGLDAQNCLPAIDRACELCEMLGCGDAVEGRIDVDHSNHELRRLPLEVEKINAFLGIEVSREEMNTMLERIGFGIDGNDVIVPSWRADIEGRADLAEEIARFYGYDNIPSRCYGGSVQGKLTPKQKFEQRLVANLVAVGCYEIATYSFVSPKNYDRIRLPEGDPRRKSVTIMNPLGEDTSVMRTTIIPSMLDILAKNYSFRNAAARLFELGFAYVPRDGEDLPDEDPRVAIGFYGAKEDFFTMKGAIEALLRAAHIRDWDVQAAPDVPWLHPGRAARLYVDGVEIGTFGEVHPLVLENYGIGTRAYVADLSFRALFEASSRVEVKYAQLPKFPATTRDLAVVCDRAIPVGVLEAAIKRGAGKLLEQITLFDVYTGAQIAAGKKSVAFSLTLRAPDRTLTDQEADEAVTKALKELVEVGAALRS